MSGEDDKPLILELAAGQEAAFAALYDRFAANSFVLPWQCIATATPPDNPHPS